jgi:hypothetical protein
LEFLDIIKIILNSVIVRNNNNIVELVPIDKIKKRYVKKATEDKKSAERQASLSDREAADTGRSKESRKSFKDESKWLKGIAAKRAKGLEMAKKK